MCSDLLFLISKMFESNEIIKIFFKRKEPYVNKMYEINRSTTYKEKMTTLFLVIENNLEIVEILCDKSGV